MKRTNNIGLDLEASQELVIQLNELLSNYQILYMNTRGFHWNIKGDDFFQLHSKFEELYNDALEKIDEIAERILTIGGVPDHSNSVYLNKSNIEEYSNISNGKKALQLIVKGYQELLRAERYILEQAGNLNDEGTVTLMSDYIAQQEKEIWMLNAYLDN